MTVHDISNNAVTLLPIQFPITAVLIGAGAGFLVKRDLIWAAVGAILAYLIAMQQWKGEQT